MDLELRHLRTLCVIADVGSVGRAAAALGYSQQAMSSQLQRIERHFGGRLFERAASGVEPTGLGADVVARARDILARVDLLGGLSEAGGEGGTRLRLAVTNTPILAGMVARLRARMPSLMLTVSSVYSSSDIVRQLEEGALDVGIAADYPGMELRHSAALEHRGIATEPSFIALPADHRLRRDLDVPLSALAEDAWFMTPDDGAGWPAVFYSACRAAGFEPASVHEYIGDRFQLQSLIADGMGVAAVQATFRPGAGVVVKALTGAPLWCRYVLVWRREAVCYETAETLFGCAAGSYRDLIAQAAHFQEWAARTYRVPYI